MFKEKSRNPTSEEILNHITHNISNKENLTKILVQEIRETETMLHLKLQKTQMDLQKIHYLNEQGNSE